jgi:hypothetical protein
MGEGPIWQPVATPPTIPDRKHLRRQVRYVALNPTRSGLVRDPLAWLWSTHRDAVGATDDPWVRASRLADALGMPRAGFASTHHAYVSADPSVAVGGTPCPLPGGVTGMPRHPLERVLRAASAARRAVEPDPLRDRHVRRLFLLLALQEGWRPRWKLAEMAGISVRQLRRLRVDDASLAAARLCLDDDRLLAPIRLRGG